MQAQAIAGVRSPDLDLHIQQLKLEREMNTVADDAQNVYEEKGMITADAGETYRSSDDNYESPVNSYYPN